MTWLKSLDNSVNFYPDLHNEQNNAEHICNFIYIYFVRSTPKFSSGELGQHLDNEHDPPNLYSELHEEGSGMR